ncbi:MAG: hypothetical protein LIO90_08365 [Bacteroidales bacterium]|nr:hypothetical protein [Bacteroidales bacterium]
MEEDPVKRPEIQDIILGTDIGCIAAELARRLEIDPCLALELFYRSRTCAQLHDKRTGLYLYGVKYLAEEFVRELQSGR